MTPKEQEIAIGELEERVDRLRNLYEQYFLGFERLEPTVPKKDVERRFALLRKEQIRNTAMRFRFNVVTQKYNTYSIHWVRICRQIEDGTYKRHVRRAKARFGDGAAPERDISIDIDMDDFDVDMDEVLEEANAAAARYERAAPDTVPPPASDRTIAEQTKPSNHAAAAVVAQIRARGPASAAVTSAPSSALSSERTPRPVMMPAGLKPRIIVRKKEDAEIGPGSTGTPTPGPAPAPASVGRTPNAPLVVRTPNAPSVGRIAPAPPLADTPVAGVPIVRPSGGGPAVKPVAGTAPKPGGPAPRPYTPASGPGSAARPAPASAGAPGAGRILVAKPTGGLPPPSERGMPAAPPSNPKPIPPAPGSAPRPPVPAPPGSAPRPPAPSRPEIARPPPAPASSPKLPPPSSPRLPPPSAPRVPVAPGSQPRAPLPLPTASRPKPKDET